MFNNKFARYLLIAVFLLCLTFTTSGVAYADGLSPTANWFGGGSYNANFGKSEDIGDFNGDGYDDALIGISSYIHESGVAKKGAVDIFYGSSSGLSTSYGWEYIESVNWNEFGSSVASCDINGDSIADVIVGDPGYDTGTLTDAGRVSVFYGSSSGPSSAADWTYVGSQQSETLGSTVSCAGDLLGNGYEGIVIGSPKFDSDGYTSNGKVMIFYGYAAGLNSTPDWAYTGWTANGTLDNWYIGLVSAAHGDLNNDGYDDVAIGIPYYQNCGGCAHYGMVIIGYGSSSAINTSLQLTGTFNGDSFGRAVAIGKIDGDDYDDLLITDYVAQNNYQSRVRMYQGLSSGINTTPVWSVLGENQNDYFGETITVAGDTNGDNYNDILITAPNYSHSNGTGKSYLYKGTDTNPSTTASWTVSQPYTSTLSLKGSRQGGDFNNDGYTDVLLSVNSFYYVNNYRGGSWAYYGSPESISGLALNHDADIHADVSNHYALSVTTGTNITYHCEFHIDEQTVSFDTKEADQTISVPVDVTCTASNSINTVDYTETFYLK